MLQTFHRAITLTLTLARNGRQFAQLNGGQWYPYKYDRRHDASVVLIYALRPRITLLATWVYGTGNALTLAQTTYNGIGPGLSYASTTNAGNGYFYQDAELYGPKNDFRMRAYHRLDVGATFSKPLKRGEGNWRVGAYNAYSRRNPYYLYYTLDSQRQRQLYQLSLFPILPAISYERGF